MHLIEQLLLLFSLSAVALFACHRLRAPTVLGWILAGAVCGPHGLALVADTEAVHTLAELGVVFLLFTIGIEFRLATLLRMRRVAAVGGGLQVAATAALVAAILAAAGEALPVALFGGLAAALSSTAIVLRTKQARGEAESLDGRLAALVLILQDLLVVPMLLVVPLLAGTQLPAPSQALRAIGEGAVILTGMVWAGRRLLPAILHHVAATRDAELFQVVTVVLGLGVAYLTWAAGLSPAIGAFFAGLLLSESPYAERALGHVLPLRDLFMGLFFVSVGMLVDAPTLGTRAPRVVPGTVGVIALKAAVAAGAGLLAGIPLRPALLAGLALAQIGEFSFVLAEAARQAGLLDEPRFQTFLGITALSMVATPFLIEHAPAIADRLLRLPWPERLRHGTVPEPLRESLRDHLVIIGFGLVGQHVADAAAAAAIPHVILEANPETVRREREAGRPIFYGDATQSPALHHAGVENARVVVVAVPDATTTRRIVEQVRRLGPRAHVIARARYFADAEPLRRLGADEVVPEEYETSIEIFTRVLHKYLVPHEEIASFAERIRAGGYRMLRSATPGRSRLSDLDLVLSDVQVRVIRVQEGAGAVGRSLAELDLRRQYGILVLAVRRGDRKVPLPDGDERVRPGDELVLLGLPELLLFADNLFRVPSRPARPPRGSTKAGD